MFNVYLLHFNKPYWTNCRHYIGYTSKPVKQRVNAHKAGKGSLLVRYALAKGCTFVVAKTWQFDTKWEARHFERRQKRNGHLPKICPKCKKNK